MLVYFLKKNQLGKSHSHVVTMLKVEEQLQVHNICELELHAAQRKIAFRPTEKANLYRSVRNVLKQKRWIIWYGPLSRTWHGCMHAHIRWNSVELDRFVFEWSEDHIAHEHTGQVGGHVVATLADISATRLTSAI